MALQGFSLLNIPFILIGRDSKGVSLRTALTYTLNKHYFVYMYIF